MTAGRRPGVLAALLFHPGFLVVAVGGLACATGATASNGGWATGGGSAARPGGASAQRGNDGKGVAAIGNPAPEIEVERLNGKKLSLSALRGKVVLLDVWASWCIPCVQELPMLDAMARRLRGKGVEVLAVSVDQERANVVKFLDSRPSWALTVAHDPRGQIADTLQPEKMPTSYAIDRAGIIRYVNEGFEPPDAAVIERKLTELAEQK